jgi:exodeoxyribonuclease VII small subunit
MTQPADTVETELTFEEALERLEKIVEQLEDGRTDLAASLAGYEDGVKLLRKCHALLERAERRIEILSGVDAEGRPVVAPFDDGATISLEEKAQTRSKRRSTKKPTLEDLPAADRSDGPSEGAPGGMDGPATLF